ncbi:hypothetical protein XENTR_v10023636 [Xenopus tropicalis]|nr:hypothetical protein XENTR_v10023636 [Xenopus tropicalis]
MDKELEFPIDITEDTHSTLAGLLEKNPRYRLGSGRNGTEDVKNSPFFQVSCPCTLRARFTYLLLIPAIK